MSCRRISCPVVSRYVMSFHVMSRHIASRLVISCRVMSTRVPLVGRFASLESREHESLTRVDVKSCFLESLPRIYATVVDKSR